MGSFIVKDIELWLETFCGEVGENVVKSFDDGGGFAVSNGPDNDGIGCVVIGNKDVLIVFQVHGRKTSH